MKTKMYRVSLNTQNSTCKDMAILACLSNGGENKVSLSDTVGYFNTQKASFPTLNSDLVISEAGNSILVDQRGQTGAVNVLHIEQVEVFKPNLPEDEN